MPTRARHTVRTYVVGAHLDTATTTTTSALKLEDLCTGSSNEFGLLLLL